MLSVTLALALAALASARLIGADGILAAFVAGAVLNDGVEGELAERQHMFNEALGRLFDLPVMVLFGAAVPWQDWIRIGWPAAAFAIGVLILRRPPAVLGLARFIPWLRRRSETAFAGWFGPIGVSAIFYACDAQLRTGLTDLWPFISLVVMASVVFHGISSTPLTGLLGRHPRGDASADESAIASGGNVPDS